MSKHKLKLGFEGHYKQKSVEVPDEEPRPWDASDRLGLVGKPVPRIDGHLKVSGQARYTHDIRLQGMLYGAVFRSPHPCAVLTSLDLSAAERAPGVRAVLGVAKQGDRLIFAGKDVAAVAADRPEQAREALELIEAEWDVQDFVVHTRAAMRDGAPVVHETAVRERRTEGDEPGSGSAAAIRGNVRPGRSMKKGDAKKALRGADVLVEATYTTQVHTHSALETHGLVVRWEDATHMTVWASTQSIFSVRDEMAQIFELEPANVRVITEYVGGGFGAKFGANAPGSAIGKIAGELAKATGRPVHLMLDRKEEHLCTGNRPDSIQKVTLGADAKGQLQAIHVSALGTAGVATGAGVGRNAFGIYSKCPNILVETKDVFTHAGPATAFRAPGHPQGAFAIESALDELAAKLELDPIELRLRHDEHPVRRYQLELARDRFDWAERRAESKRRRDGNARVRRGVGVASSIWGDFGGPGAVATVSVDRNARIEVRNGIQDIGSGIGTILAQVTAEVFGRPLDQVTVKIGQSDYGPGTGSGGSKTTSTVTPAVRNAAEKVKTQLVALAAKELGASNPSKVEWGADGSARFGRKSIAFKDLCKRIEGEAIVATGRRAATYGSYPRKFPGGDMYQIAGVQMAAVEVDTWTGVVRCREVLAVHDCGRVMNGLTLRSQINGGVILGTGYALMEQRIMDPELGVMLNANLEAYKPLGALDVPEIQILLTEVAVGNNSTGAIGIGEPSTIPTAAAIANGVADALGAPVRSLPITPDHVLRVLEGAGA